MFLHSPVGLIYLVPPASRPGVHGNEIVWVSWSEFENSPNLRASTRKIFSPEIFRDLDERVNRFIDSLAESEKVQMTSREAIAFVERHGVVLQAARGPVPNLAE